MGPSRPVRSPGSVERPRGVPTASVTTGYRTASAAASKAA